MSEPEVYTVSTHPCAQCGGPRTVEFREWLDPTSAYIVVCKGCGNAQGGETLEAAVEAWDAANPMRDVTSEEAQAVSMMLLSAQMTPQVLTVVQDALDAFARSGEVQDLPTFAAWCASLMPEGSPA
jgi:hypothetical protein